MPHLPGFCRASDSIRLPAATREAVHCLLRDQSRIPLCGRGRSLRQPAERFLAAARRCRPHAPPARARRPVGAARARLRPDECRLPHDDGQFGPSPERLRGVSRATRTDRARAAAPHHRFRRQGGLRGSVQRAARPGPARAAARGHDPLRTPLDIPGERRGALRGAPALVPRARGTQQRSVTFSSLSAHHPRGFPL
jgi:hypothetical protein